MLIKSVLTREANADELRKDFLKDLHEFFSKEIKLEFDSTGYEKGRYASLLAVTKATRSVLHEHNFMFFEISSTTENRHIYNFMLLHKNGMYIDSEYMSAIEITNDNATGAGKSCRTKNLSKDICQAVGMEHTYYNRYAHCNMLGLVGDEADLDKLAPAHPVQQVKQIEKRTMKDIENIMPQLLAINEKIEKEKALETIKEIGKGDINKMYSIAQRAISNSQGFIAYYEKMHNKQKSTPVKSETATATSSEEKDLSMMINALLGEPALVAKNITKEKVEKVLEGLCPNGSTAQRLDVINNALMYPESFVSSISKFFKRVAK